MKRFTFLLTINLFFCCIFSISAFAQGKERDMAKEQLIQNQLQTIAPKTVEKFKAATEALDAKRFHESAELYKEVLAQAPTFEPALRRMGFALIGEGKREEGIKASRAALNLSRSPENLIGVAQILAEPGAGNRQPTPTELEEAFTLSREAMQKDGEKDSDYMMINAQLSLMTNHLQDFTNVSKKLNEKFPQEAATHYFNGLRLANEGDLDAAEAELKKSEALGMPKESTQEILAAIETEKNSGAYLFWKYFYYGLYLIGAWTVGLVVLFVAGKILSAKMMRSLENSDPNDITGASQAGLRGVYKKVIAAAGVYYYLSQPVVMLLVLVVAGGITVFFFWVGTIPIKLLLIVGFVALATIFYMVKSLVIRAKVEDPGRILTETEAPGLWALARDVAQTVNTRPIDEIRITNGAELAVYERGGIGAKMQDKAERILIVGVAALNDFSQNAFRAVLAHEYGHFSNRDTAGGDIAWRVNNDIIRLAESMALSGTATVYNIAFQFLRFYHFLFRRITHGASRMQEILADRVAVHLYGANAFREGLTHVIRRDIEFNLVASKEINEVLGSNRAMQNLYELTELDDSIKKDLEQQYNENISRPTTDDDTHPSPEDRFKWASQIKSRECVPISGMVWDLFKNKVALTQEMNRLLESRIRAAM